MLSSIAIRTCAALLALAMLATVAGGAQCVVQCAKPASPPPCHHHSQGKQNPPAMACAADMLPGKAGTETAPAVPVIAANRPVPIAITLAISASTDLPLTHHLTPEPFFVLRI